MNRKFLLGLVLCLATLIVYGGSYAVMRCDGILIRRIGKDGCWMSGTGIFEPAWIVERKTRSLCWRIHNGAPLFGHVYWSQIKR